MKSEEDPVIDKKAIKTLVEFFIMAISSVTTNYFQAEGYSSEIILTSMFIFWISTIMFLNDGCR